MPRNFRPVTKKEEKERKKGWGYVVNTLINIFFS